MDLAGTLVRTRQHSDAGKAGVILATVGGLGWASTENLLYLLPILGALAVAGANAWYAVKFARAKAAIDLEVYRARVRKRETDLELKILEPAPDPDPL